MFMRTNRIFVRCVELVWDLDDLTRASVVRECPEINLNCLCKCVAPKPRGGRGRGAGGAGRGRGRGRDRKV